MLERAGVAVRERTPQCLQPGLQPGGTPRRLALSTLAFFPRSSRAGSEEKT
jgi:hypothetical protein